MANDRNGKAIATGQVYVLAGAAREVSGDSVLLVTGDGRHAIRVAAGDVVLADDAGPGVLDGSSWSGSLAGSGITTAQQLADWIDANVTAGG